MRWHWWGGLAVALATVACGRTPLPEPEEGTGETGDVDPMTTGPLTTGVPPDPGTSDTGSVDTGDDTGGMDTGDDTGGAILDLGEPAPTCRDIVMCALGCLTQLDFTCLQECGAGAPPEESAAALNLTQCVAGVCFEKGKCDFSGITEDCATCIGFGLFAPEPTGCEAEAAACM